MILIPLVILESRGCSSMKFFLPADPGGGINQIPAECTISGDVRFILFPECLSSLLTCILTKTLFLGL